LPAACTAPPLQPPSRIFLLTGPRGNGQSALVHLIAKDLPNCLHIRAGDLVGNYRLSAQSV
jgi:Holliday junction resolvasome RuvABC ATP-dependent DNA helicase subunit